MINEILKTSVENLFSKLTSRFTKEVVQVAKNRLLEYQVEEFQKNNFTKTILHRTQPVPLTDFYVPLYIRRAGRNFQSERINTSSSEYFFNENQFVTLLGTAGSGKSTIVKYLLVDSLKTDFKTPIKIELRYLNNYDDGLFDYINEEIFKLSQLAFDKAIINRLLHSGDFIFFFDGYDELSSSVKDKITKEINDFVSLYNKNSYLVTSRPYTNVELLPKFKNFEVCSLSEDEIEHFIKKQIPASEHEIAEKIIEAVRGDQNNSYLGFLSNPLLLSMFILTYQTYSNVPPKRSTFYRQVFESLFYLHDSVSKLSWARERKSDLNKEDFEYVLKIFSFVTFFKEVFVFEESYLNDTLTKIKQKKKGLTFDNQKLIDDLQVAVCILYKEGLDYVFPHRSLQEYFASLYIINLDSKNKAEAYKKILEHFNKLGDFLVFLSRDNFYSLLAEQDPVGVTQNLSIPFLESSLEELKSKNLTKKEYGAFATNLMMFIISFHRDSIYTKDLQLKLQDYFTERQNIVKTIRIKPGSNKIELTLDQSIKIEKLEEDAIKAIRTLIPKTIKSLKDFITEQTNSDSSILELIDEIDFED